MRTDPRSKLAVLYFKRIMIIRLAWLAKAAALRPAATTAPRRTRLHAAAGDGWRHLDRAFAVRGPVAKGYGRGAAKLGFATANLDAEVIGDVLGDVEQGVYAAFYQTAVSDKPQRAVVNVGVAPTFEGQEQPVKLVEAHLLDHDGSDLYGDALALLLVAFIRPEMKFDGIDALKAQIGADCETAKSCLAEEAVASLNYVQEGFLSAAARPVPASATQWFSKREDSGIVGQSPYV